MTQPAESGITVRAHHHNNVRETKVAEKPNDTDHASGSTSIKKTAAAAAETSNAKRGEEALNHLKRELDSRDRKEKSKPLSVAALSAVVIFLIGGAIYFAATQNSDEEEITASEETTAAEQDSSEENAVDPAEYEAVGTERATALPPTVSCSYNDSPQASEGDAASKPETDDISTNGKVNIELDTTAGPIGMELDRSVAPCTVNAIEHLAQEKYFDDSVCHRLTTGEGLKVLQCGDPTGSGSGGPGFQFANEFPTDEALEKVDDAQLQLPEGISDEEKEQYRAMELQNQPQRYDRGTIAMANAGVGTNGSQFFLNYGDSILPPMYTYFVQIADEGLATLDTIAEKGAEGGATDGAPAEEVKIKTATVK